MKNDGKISRFNNHKLNIFVLFFLVFFFFAKGNILWLLCNIKKAPLIKKNRIQHHFISKKIACFVKSTSAVYPKKITTVHISPLVSSVRRAIKANDFFYELLEQNSVVGFLLYPAVTVFLFSLLHYTTLKNSRRRHGKIESFKHFFFKKKG